MFFLILVNLKMMWFAVSSKELLVLVVVTLRNSDRLETDRSSQPRNCKGMIMIVMWLCVETWFSIFLIVCTVHCAIEQYRICSWRALSCLQIYQFQKVLNAWCHECIYRIKHCVRILKWARKLQNKIMTCTKYRWLSGSKEQWDSDRAVQTLDFVSFVSH